MSDNVVLYCENLPTEGMETLIAELCPPELDLRFLYPVKNGKKGDFEDADYILASIHKIGKDEMDRAKNLKLIHVPATGYNHVDLEYAKQKGIPVCNSNGENATTTAEFTIALMLACMRRLSMIDRRCKQGEWHSWTWRHDSYELRDKVIGVVGAWFSSAFRAGSARTSCTTIRTRCPRSLKRSCTADALISRLCCASPTSSPCTAR